MPRGVYKRTKFHKERIKEGMNKEPIVDKPLKVELNEPIVEELNITSPEKIGLGPSEIQRVCDCGFFGYLPVSIMKCPACNHKLKFNGKVLVLDRRYNNAREHD